MLEALNAAARDFFRPRMLGLVLWPLLGSLLLWGGLLYYFWHSLAQWLQHLAAVWYLPRWVGEAVLRWLSQFGLALAALLMVPALVHGTALLITAIVAMPVMVREVTRRDYPQLEARHGGSFAGATWNALASTFAYLLLWLLTLPLWLLGFPAAVLPVLLNGWLNDRLFRYDALSGHASREEYRLLSRRAGGRFFLLGCIAAAIQLVPLLNLITPVYSGLSFIHFACTELARLRLAPAAAPVRPRRI
ncbi:MAG: EI24 domain-containing protein [Nevskia sp.]|nr:EI24 domain-containing protein [Nevskia sp.]